LLALLAFEEVKKHRSRPLSASRSPFSLAA
jgi:hypothetical protein